MRRVWHPRDIYWLSVMTIKCVSSTLMVIGNGTKYLFLLSAWFSCDQNASGKKKSTVLGLWTFEIWSTHVVIKNSDKFHWTHLLMKWTFQITWLHDLIWISIEIQNDFLLCYSFDFFKGLVRRKLDWTRFLDTFHKRLQLYRTFALCIYYNEGFCL